MQELLVIELLKVLCGECGSTGTRSPQVSPKFKPLDKTFRWIRYLIPNKKNLLDQLSLAVRFSKVNMKSGYWKIQIAKKDKYKTAFNLLFGYYK